jgi:hypothetical protein
VAQRLEQRLLDDVFGQRQVMRAEDPGQGGDHPARLMPEQMIGKRIDLRPIV